MTGVRATGGGDLARLARDLKEAGRTDLRKELYRGLNRATKPLRADAKARARAILPHSGGLATRVAAARLTTKTRTGSSPGIRIVAKENRRAPVDVSSIDDGLVRHPTFGHRPLINQRVPSGWFTGAMIAGAPAVRAELLQAIDDVIKKLEG